MYGIQGFDDEETLRQLLMPNNETDGGDFQAQPTQAPELAQLLAGGTEQPLQDMSELGSGNAQNMADVGRQIANSAMAAGANRIAQQQTANQAAMQQDQQSRGGGSLLGSLLKIGANIALNKWIGGMFPKRGG